jgi:hypothetical protein
MKLPASSKELPKQEIPISEEKKVEQQPQEATSA